MRQSFGQPRAAWQLTCCRSVRAAGGALLDRTSQLLRPGPGRFPFTPPATLCSGLLLATWFNSRVGALRKGFVSRPHRNDPWILVFLVLGLLLLVIVLDQCYRHWLRRRTQVAPDMLSRAADMLEISPIDVRLLRNAARRLGVAHPLSLLLSPANLERAAAALESGRLSFLSRGRLQRLGRRLFPS